MTLDLTVMLVGSVGFLAATAWAWRHDFRRARAMLEAEREADVELREAVRAQSAKRKAPAKPVVSPYRLAQKNDGAAAPPPEPPKVVTETTVIKATVAIAATMVQALKPTYREPARRTYHKEPRFVCCRCGARYVQRFDPTEIDLYEHCPACKQKAVHQT